MIGFSFRFLLYEYSIYATKSPLILHIGPFSCNIVTLEMESIPFCLLEAFTKKKKKNLKYCQNDFWSVFKSLLYENFLSFPTTECLFLFLRLSPYRLQYSHPACSIRH